MISKKKKAIFFVPSAAGGAERMTINIAKCLSLDKYDVRFYIVSKEKGEIKSFIPQGYVVKHLKIFNIYDFVTLKLIRIIRKEKADVAFSSMHYLNVRLISACMFCHTHVIVRSNTGLYRNDKITVFLIKLLYKFADIVIAQQDEMRSEIIKVAKVSPNRIVTMSNILDTVTIQAKAMEPSPYDNSEDIRFIIVGRADDPVKGHDVAIQAFSIVKKTISKTQLYVVGKFDKNIDFCQKLIKLVEDLGVQQSVHFIGYDSNPYKWIKNANCYVLSSRQEGMPNVLLEALWLHVPCVATNCVPVIERIVNDGENGYVVPSEDYKALARGMIDAIQLKSVHNSFKTSTPQDFSNLFNKICEQ